MFYPVKIKDGKGKVKKVLPSKKLSKDYWDNYFGALKKKVPLHLQKKKDQKAKDATDLPNDTLDESLGNDEYTLD
jgi:hypothetical protein